MTEDKNKRPIVIKRVKKVAAGHHGGSWKIAYADFVTAMMAFFLLMWLLANTTQATREGIAEYFRTPLKVALTGGAGSGERTSIIQGGGQDLTRSAGEVKKGQIPEEKKIPDLKTSSQDILRAERKKEIEKLKDLKATIERAIDNNAKLQQFKKQIMLDITSEGLRILIVDEQNRPMFLIGSDKLEPYTKVILHEIGQMLNEVPNKVSISGHTDAAIYMAGDKGYSNWELSADRANASRRELVAGGMSDKKIVRVVGLSSAAMLDKENPLNPINRRISLIVMNKKAEEAASHDGGIVGMEVEGDTQELRDAIQGVPTEPAAAPADPAAPGSR